MGYTQGVTLCALFMCIALAPASAKGNGRRPTGFLTPHDASGLVALQKEPEEADAEADAAPETTKKPAPKKKAAPKKKKQPEETEAEENVVDQTYDQTEQLGKKALATGTGMVPVNAPATWGTTCAYLLILLFCGCCCITPAAQWLGFQGSKMMRTAGSALGCCACMLPFIVLAYITFYTPLLTRFYNGGFTRVGFWCGILCVWAVLSLICGCLQVIFLVAQTLGLIDKKPNIGMGRMPGFSTHESAAAYPPYSDRYAERYAGPPTDQVYAGPPPAYAGPPPQATYAPRPSMGPAYPAAQPAFTSSYDGPAVLSAQPIRPGIQSMPPASRVNMARQSMA